MGSIGGGGRYDKLTDLFGLKNTSGFGISFGFDRIFLVLEELNLFPPTLDHKTQLMFLNFGDDSASFCFDQLIKLRDQEFPCEFYPKPAKLKKQLNYANQRSIPYVVILGSEEMQKKVFVLKNMVSGDQEEHPIAQMFKVLQELN
jgi:histidyl-tRNA synthetase